MKAIVRRLEKQVAKLEAMASKFQPVDDDHEGEEL
jgi:hypothetical protein